MNIDPVQLAFAKESLANLKKLAETLKDLPPAPSKMQLLKHTEVCALSWLWDVVEKQADAFKDIFAKYEVAMTDVRKILDNKGTRAQVNERLDQLKKDIGL